MKKILFAIVAVLMFAFSAFAGELEVTQTKMEIYNYKSFAYDNGTLAQATSGNTNEASAALIGVAISGSMQSNDAKAVQCGPISYAETNSAGFTGAGALGLAQASGMNAGLSNAQAVDLLSIASGSGFDLKVKTFTIEQHRR